MRLADLIDILDSIAPTRYAESWDNVGLLAGDPAANIRKAFLTIDFTPAVAKEVFVARANLVIAYHPPIFQPLKRIAASSPVYQAIRRGIAVYSPHTALDVAVGGTNDVLAEILGIAKPAALRPLAGSPWHHKLIVFVPRDAANKVADALFDAGAGHIGNYSHCSFRADGTGTFLPHEGTRPAMGKIGALERVAETRLEVIVPTRALGAVISALRATHPYEEPAFDIMQLTAPPTDQCPGQGRIGRVKPTGRAALIGRIRQKLGVKHVLVAGPTRGTVKTAACLAGDGGSFIEDAIAQKVDLFLTGEMKHHNALAAAAAGMTVVCALHSNSERIALPRYAERIRKSAGIAVVMSRVDRDPFTIE